MRTDDDTKAQLPRHIRPLAFAGTELALDICNAIRVIYDVDIESAVILLCVSDATMRPLFEARSEAGITQAVHPDPNDRGSISRLMVADKTGLPRETVRRKITELAKLGLVEIDDNDRVQIKTRLQDPHIQRALEEGHRAVLRYFARLRALGINPDDPASS